MATRIREQSEYRLQIHNRVHRNNEGMAGLGEFSPDVDPLERAKDEAVRSGFDATFPSLFTW